MLNKLFRIHDEPSADPAHELGDLKALLDEQRHYAAAAADASDRRIAGLEEELAQARSDIRGLEATVTLHMQAVAQRDWQLEQQREHARQVIRLATQITAPVQQAAEPEAEGIRQQITIERKVPRHHAGGVPIDRGPLTEEEIHEQVEAEG